MHRSRLRAIAYARRSPPPTLSMCPQLALTLPTDATPVQKQVNELILRLVYSKFNDRSTETALYALGEPAVRELFRACAPARWCGTTHASI
jgi:hypothetical protein